MELTAAIQLIALTTERKHQKINLNLHLIEE